MDQETQTENNEVLSGNEFRVFAFRVYHSISLTAVQFQCGSIHRPVTRDENKNLNNIFKYMRDCRLSSLSTFLDACFRSTDENVKGKVESFYRQEGPSRCITAWRKGITNKKHFKAALDSATSLVLVEVQKEMVRASKCTDLQAPASEVTAKTLDDFSLGHITKHLLAKAPTTHRLITGILDKRNPFDTTVPDPAVAVVASIALYWWNKRANYLQVVLGLYFYSQGASSSLISVLQKAGVSVSYDSIQRALGSLTKSHLKKVREVVKREEGGFLIGYDNINMAFRRHDQHFDNKDTFENGATATLVVTAQKPTVDMSKDYTDQLSMEDLYPTREQSARLSTTYCYHLTEVLVRRVKGFEHNPFPVQVLSPPSLAKTEMYPLPSMHIDQSTVDGNRDILEEIMEKATQLNPEWFERRRLILAGDQLTLSRIRSIARLRWDEPKAYHRLEWAIPVVQLFHLQMLFAKTIFKTHHGQNDKKPTPGSLGHFLRVLERKRISLDKSNFHDLDQFLRQVFDGVVLLIWEAEFLPADMETSAVSASIQDEVRTKAEHITRKYLSTARHSSICNQQSKNAALFIRDMLHYLELGSAIKAGDIGRIGDSIRWITILLQAGSTQNYANELLRLHCQMFYSSDKNTKSVIMSSMVVNTTGQPNRYIPCDLLQEHHNLLTKFVYNAKGSKLSWQYLRDKISTNIRVFQSIAAKLHEQFNIVRSGTNHTTDPAVADIKKIKDICTRSGIFTDDFEPLKDDIPAVIDLLLAGRKKLTDGNRIVNFKKSAQSCWQQNHDVLGADLEDQDEDQEMEEAGVMDGDQEDNEDDPLFEIDDETIDYYFNSL
jgi:hypothetical protein